MRQSALTILTLLTLTATALSDTPAITPTPNNPSGDPSSVLTGRFLAWLTADDADGVTSADFLAAGAAVLPFDHSGKSGAAELGGRFVDGRVLATALYTGRPATLAADLSQQLQAAEDVPAEKLQSLIVPPTRTTRANQVAADFVGELLDIADDDCVGVAVIYYADVKHHSLLDGATPEMKVMMVLFVMPAPTESTAALKIARIAFGELRGSTDK